MPMPPESAARIATALVTLLEELTRLVRDVRLREEKSKISSMPDPTAGGLHGP